MMCCLLDDVVGDRRTPDEALETLNIISSTPDATGDARQCNAIANRATQSGISLSHVVSHVIITVT